MVNYCIQLCALAHLVLLALVGTKRFLHVLWCGGLLQLVLENVVERTHSSSCGIGLPCVVASEFVPRQIQVQSVLGSVYFLMLCRMHF